MPDSAKSNDLYFVTLTIVGWVDIFIRDEYRQLITDNLDYCRKHKGMRVFEYVLMSNHLHVIAISDKKPLSDVLRDFKTYTSKQLYAVIKGNPQGSRKAWMLHLFEQAGEQNERNKHIQVWQNGNYPVLLYSNEMITQKTDYIHQNPVRAGWVSEPHHYVYSSASPDSPLICDTF